MLSAKLTSKLPTYYTYCNGNLHLVTINSRFLGSKKPASSGNKTNVDQDLHPETSNYEVWIGLETHAQVTSYAKLFSGSSTSFNAPPNSCTSFFDAALPGTLPKLNVKCVEQAIKTGLALNGTPQTTSFFDRKHYFYCDTPLGFQITQQRVPIVVGGSLSLDSQLPSGQSRDIRISRIQLEQDSGKSLHDVAIGKTHVDLNRAGTALMEIVTEPDLRSSEEATIYLKKLQTLLRCIDASSGNMEDGSFRCDVNVTVRKINPPGKMTGRVEIKNMMSFRSISRAIDYEVQRQISIEESGGLVERETRQWDVKKQQTYRLRKKEDLLDYRFFPEPDLPPLRILPQYIESIQKTLPELPDMTYMKLTKFLGLTQETANIILAEKDASIYFMELVGFQADIYEKILSSSKYLSSGIIDDDMLSSLTSRSPKICNNWLTSELFGRIRKMRSELYSELVQSNSLDMTMENDPRVVPLLHECPIEAVRLGELIDLVVSGNISGKQAKVVLGMMFTDTRCPTIIAEENNLVMDSDPIRLKAICDQIIQLYPDEVEKARSGRANIFKFLCGQGLKLSQKQKTAGEANPEKLAQVMKEALDDLEV